MSINLELTPLDTVKPCPFCGSTDLELCNTWTASYWIECLWCGAQMHGESFNEGWDHLQLRMRHVKAKESAIKRWNSRVAT
jgi:Lar family restriction alleviation protein